MAAASGRRKAATVRTRDLPRRWMWRMAVKRRIAESRSESGLMMAAMPAERPASEISQDLPERRA